MKRFEFLEHTADILIAAYGRSLEEAFENSALAVFEVITDTSRVEPRVKKDIHVEGSDLENLLYRWIEELLVFHDAEGLVFSRFKVNKIEKMDDLYILEAEAWGEPFDEERHEYRTIVKAMTYAQMKIERMNNGFWRIQFVVDI